MLDEDIGQPQLQHGAHDAHGVERLGHRTARTAHDGALFHRHKRVVALRHLAQQGFVDGLGPAHVDHGGIDRLAHFERGIQQGAECQDGNAGRLAVGLALALAADLALAEG